MTDVLDIGRSVAGEPFPLPTALGTQTSAIVGIRGSGKTVTATVVAEELLGRGHQVVVIDPTDVWWGLKSGADGQEEGYPVVIFGGPHGDLPLKPDMGTAIADFAVEERRPLILSLRHLRKGAQRAFVTSFAEQLYHRKGEAAHRTPLLVVIDEASAFVPQRVGGADARMVGAIEDLVRRGRAAGLGVTLVDQRPASINKDVLTQLEVLVAHRVTSPQDRKALDEWIRQHDTEGHRDRFLEQLPSLPQGTAWFWSPALDVFERVRVRMRETFDSSRTPKPGEAARAPTAWAAVDLDALRERLADALEEAEQSDPRALRRRIAELEGELRKARAGVEADPAATERAVAAALAPIRRRLAQAAELMGGMDDDLTGLTVLANSLRGYRDSLELAIGQVLGADDSGPASPASSTAAAVPAAPRSSTTPSPRTSRTRPERTPSTPAGDPDLPAPRRRILAALARFEALGIHHVSRANLAVFSGQSPRSSAYTAHLAALEQAGLVTYPEAGHARLTAAGQAIAPESAPIRSLDELHQAWFRYLPDPQVRMLRALIARYPGAYTRDDLATQTGQSPKSSAFAAHVSALAGLGLVWYPAPGEVAATELLFPAELG